MNMNYLYHCKSLTAAQLLPLATLISQVQGPQSLRITIVSLNLTHICLKLSQQSMNSGLILHLVLLAPFNHHCCFFHWSVVVFFLSNCCKLLLCWRTCSDFRLKRSGHGAGGHSVSCRCNGAIIHNSWMLWTLAQCILAPAASIVTVTILSSVFLVSMPIKYLKKRGGGDHWSAPLNNKAIKIALSDDLQAWGEI